MKESLVNFLEKIFGSIGLTSDTGLSLLMVLVIGVYAFRLLNWKKWDNMSSTDIALSMGMVLSGLIVIYYLNFY